MASDKILDRIRKLLALARSSNPHEAAAAAARAAELMAQHQLAEASLEHEDEAIGEHELERCGRKVTWKSILARGVCIACACDCYWTRPWRLGADERSLRIVGRASDVDAARYLYAYLVREIERLARAAWDARQRESPLDSARAWKNAFRSGAASEIAMRLRTARDEALAAARRRADADTAASKAVVRVDRDAAAVADYMSRLNLVSPRPALVSSATGLYQGRIAGAQVNLGGNPSLHRPARQLTGGHGSKR